RSLLDSATGVLVAGSALSAGAKIGELEQSIRPRRGAETLEQRPGCGALGVTGGHVLHETGGGVAKFLDRLVERRCVAELQHELPAGRPQRLVDAGQHPSQSARSVRREQAQTVGLVAGAEILQRTVERLAPQ